MRSGSPLTEPIDGVGQRCAVRGPVGLLRRGRTVAASQRAFSSGKPDKAIHALEEAREPHASLSQHPSGPAAASGLRARARVPKGPCAGFVRPQAYQTGKILEGRGGEGDRSSDSSSGPSHRGGASSGGRGEEAAGGAQVLGAAGEGGQRRVEVLANQGLAEEEAARTASAGRGQARDEEEVGDAGLGPAQEPAADHAAQEVAQGWDLCAAMRARVGRLRACMGLSGMSSR